MNNIILITKAELRNEILSALNQHYNQTKTKHPPKLYSINQVAKLLGKSHSTIKKYVLEGMIKTTKSGLISEEAINEYLNG